MIITIFLCKILIEIIILIFLLQSWIFFTIKNNCNSFTKFIILLTEIFLICIKNIIPNIKKNKFLPLLILIFLIFIKYPILVFLQNGNLFHHNLIFYIFISIVILLKSFGYLFFWIINVYLITNFINIKYNNFNYILAKLVNQILNFVKKIFPHIHNMKLCLFIINLILYLINNLLKNFFPQFWFLI
ncbi:hypothetical protein [Enterobacteriaceae endosymbiont of Donacia clavipes]|uniref:hypothetical protein n=1 Tax=Enterobacteriaceae endosymbiont of Donacia clavipes TaxID=2675775 RepID=UPI001448A525|nr:hypothetical protein [Enterobacteriaceae endosymbiont of Donacia clavipes]QJC33351.1 hypothetical protein GJT92_01370 [Enterobacteriaceae endosymbiont of Donacia clavipes]